MKIIEGGKMNNYDSISLDIWINNHPSEEEMRVVFLNMDMALKYIHDHGYCIDVFYPTEIEILNNELDHIQFKKLVELSKDPSNRQNMIKEDIFNSSLMQIGMYFYSEGLGLSIYEILASLKPEILKENFEAYSEVIPNGDVPYYRGVILRGASVYFNEFAIEKRNRELLELEKELGEDKSKVKALTIDKKAEYTNKINDAIYRQINGLKDAAFINTLIIPTVILMIGVIIALILWFISL